MNTIRNVVQGGPVVSCVQCPSCQTFVPISEGNSPIISPATAVSIVRPKYSEQPPVTVQPAPTIAVRSIERRPPISTVPTYQQVPDNRSNNQAPIYVNPVPVTFPSNVSEHERSWRSIFPRIPVYVLSIVQLVLTVLIFILEIASLAVLIYIPTGVGIWCALAFLPACLLTFRLGE
jgi:hypothetical protein